MLKILLRSAVAGLVSVSLLLLSCDKSPSAPVSGNSGSFGSAVVKLPDLSSGALSKSSAIIDSNSLTLLIVASNMDTIKHSWSVSSLKGQTVKIDGIPSGDNRCFEGFLTNKSGVLTHSGKVTVKIIAGQYVPVYLKLSGVGGADVCIEIEGYPSSCNSNDSIYVNTCLKGNTPTDTLTGTIQLNIIGGKSSGQFTLADSKEKTTYIFYRPVQIHDSVIQTVVINSSNKKNQALNMVINSRSEIVYAYLSTDSIIYSPAVAKFHSVPCYDTSSSTNVNSCLQGSTQNGNLSGNIQFQVYSGKASGQITFVTSGVKNSYLFMMPVQITGSGNAKRCQTQVLNISNKKYQYLDMGINSSQISYGYLYADSVGSSSVVAKFFSVLCTDTIPVDTVRIDTSVMKFNFAGVGINPDTSKFTSNLLIKLAGNNATGTLITSNFSQIPDTLPVGGTGNVDQNGYGSFILYSITPDSKSGYQIVIKFAPDFYDGYISKTDGSIRNTIAHLTSSGITK